MDITTVQRANVHVTKLQLIDSGCSAYRTGDVSKIESWITVHDS